MRPRSQKSRPHGSAESSAAGQIKNSARRRRKKIGVLQGFSAKNERSGVFTQARSAAAVGFTKKNTIPRVDSGWIPQDFRWIRNPGNPPWKSPFKGGRKRGRCKKLPKTGFGKKESASAGNRTRVNWLATSYYTTKPPRLLITTSAFLQLINRFARM